jgi:hypothetical protein
MTRSSSRATRVPENEAPTGHRFAGLRTARILHGFVLLSAPFDALWLWTGSLVVLSEPLILLVFAGAGGENRTHDLPLTKGLRYHYATPATETGPARA